MWRLRVFLFALIALLGVGLASPKGALAADAKPALETAVFSGGCFWCMESDMKAVPGVVSVQSGYTGGTMIHPSYQDVLTEQTGHYESIKVTFDASKITYPQLLTRYWKLVDPTDNDGQFCDRGPSYRPAIWVNGPQQQAQAEASKAVAASQLKTGVMKERILPLGAFWPAEDYHRDYAARHPVEYELYRKGCGRDARLTQVWGRAG